MEDFARAWNKWFDVIEVGARPVSERMIELAGITAGQRVLDLATGIGEPALTLARKVGGSGEVVALDHSPQMLAFGRQRADAAGVNNIDFREMDLDSLDLPEGHFDAVFCRWGLMFVADLPRCLAAIHKALRPGGAFAATVWGAAEKAPSLSLSMQVANQVLGIVDPAVPAPFSLADVDAFRAEITRAGFGTFSGEWVPVVYEFPSAQAYLEHRLDCSALFRDRLALLSKDKKQAVMSAITEAVEAYRSDSGRLRMVNQTYCAVGKKP